MGANWVQIEPIKPSHSKFKVCPPQAKCGPPKKFAQKSPEKLKRKVDIFMDNSKKWELFIAKKR